MQPLSLDKYTNVSLSHDINPDSNFFSDTFNCEYYTESGLNGLIHENASNTEGLSLFHINNRNIRCNFSRLTINSRLLVSLKPGCKIHHILLTLKDTILYITTDLIDLEAELVYI